MPDSLYNRRDAKKLAEYNTRIMRTAYKHLGSRTHPFELQEFKTHSRRIEQLVRIIRRLEVSLSISPNHLSPLAENLRVDLIPTRLQQVQRRISSALATELAYKSIIAITSCKFHLPRNAALVDYIIDLWPAIWAWMQFLLNPMIHDDNFSSLVRAEALICIGNFLQAFGAHNSIRRVLLATPGIVEMMTLCWMEEGDSEIHNDFDISGDRNDLFAMAIIILLREDEFQAHVGELLYAANGHKNLARVAVCRMRKVLDQCVDSAPADSSRNDLVFPHLAILFELMCPKVRPALFDAGLASGAVLQVVRYLGAIADWSAGNGRKGPCGIVLCFSILCVGLGHSQSRHHLLVRAIKDGLITAALGSANTINPSISNENQGNTNDAQRGMCQDFLECVVAPRLVCMAVVKAVAKLDVENNPYVITLGEPMKGKWHAFCDLFRRRHRLMTDLEQKFLTRCFHCQRDFGGRQSMKQCARCQVYRYCSRACQKAAWPRHKAHCRDWRDGIATGDGEDDRSSSDVPVWTKLYIIDIAWQELFLRTDEVNAIIDNDHSSAALSDLIFHVDLSCYPPWLCVMPRNRTEHELRAQADQDLTSIRMQMEFCWGSRKPVSASNSAPPPDFNGAEFMLFWKRFFYDSSSRDEVTEEDSEDQVND